MSSSWGKHLSFQIFGESHGQAIGIVVEGFPAGFTPDLQELNRFLARRKPGTSPLTTQRQEDDLPEFLSGIKDGHLTGAPLCAILRNQDAHSSDYKLLADTPRPGHADFPAEMKYQGFQDKRGGGHFSGRLTAPLCIAGGIAKQILAHKKILVGAHLLSVGSLEDRAFSPVTLTQEELLAPGNAPFPTLDEAIAPKMQNAIQEARQAGDSLGGIIEGAVLGLPAGLGEPMFDGVENRLSSLLFGIPAVRGIEFGAGFAATRMKGSQNNDQYTIDAHGDITTLTNHHGGVLGGLTTGMPLLVKVAIKPTPSIALPQQTVHLKTRQITQITVPGRHDPCIAPRAVPVVEAALALGILDFLTP